jgi:hypothetical protein
MKHLQFSFHEPSLSRIAYTTLLELSFDAKLATETDDIVNVYIQDDELTSALEITQAYGGELVNDTGEKEYTPSSLHAFQQAYSMGVDPFDNNETEIDHYNDNGGDMLSSYANESPYSDPIINKGFFELNNHGGVPLEGEMEQLE